MKRKLLSALAIAAAAASFSAFAANIQSTDTYPAGYTCYDNGGYCGSYARDNDYGYCHDGYDHDGYHHGGCWR